MPEADFTAPVDPWPPQDPGPVGPEPHDAAPGEIRNVSGQTLYLSEIDRNVAHDSTARVADVTGYAHQPAWEVVPPVADAAPPAPAKAAVSLPVSSPPKDDTSTDPTPADKPAEK